MAVPDLPLETMKMGCATMICPYLITLRPGENRLAVNTLLAIAALEIVKFEK